MYLSLILTLRSRRLLIVLAICPPPPASSSTKGELHDHLPRSPSSQISIGVGSQNRTALTDLEAPSPCSRKSTEVCDGSILYISPLSIALTDLEAPSPPFTVDKT
ncbi:hypothetical protein L2E82_12953 [Cichorium intybus]|uniref:Uncharacterized protein n=1 Tax=Cichorium intybus TaxID=13427 RepID=A0ACB9GHI1_CICIN|nr:hypothetical protein L2E82_12953 [Cichorium intybus]